jgi:hypothetical protein
MNTTTYKLKKMKLKKDELKAGFWIFGNKGNVWSDNAHIFKAGSSATLCGVPMLSNNWAKLDGVEHIGCEKCLKIYNEKTLLEIINTDGEPNILNHI